VTAELITILAGCMSCGLKSFEISRGLPGLYGLDLDGSTVQMVTIRLNLL